MPRMRHADSREGSRMIRRLLAAACFSILMAVVHTGRAIARFGDDSRPLWMTDVSRWYDEAIRAAMYGIVAVACIAYLRRKSRNLPAPAAGASPARSSRWRDRVELRVVLYCSAVFLALQLPLSVIATLRAMYDATSPWPRTFWSLFPIGGCLGPLIGAAIVVYDRRRITREDREDSGSCLSCGYDLRASKDRCPECGTPIPLKSRATT